LRFRGHQIAGESLSRFVWLEIYKIVSIEVFGDAIDYRMSDPTMINENINHEK